MKITKEEWAAVIKDSWSIDLNNYEIINSEGVYITKTGSRSPWRAQYTYSDSSGTVQGTIGDVETLEFLDNNALLLISDYIKYGKHHHREYLLVRDGFNITVTIIRNDQYSEFILKKMDDIKQDSGYPLVLQNLGVEISETDKFIADAMTKRIFTTKKVAADNLLDNAELIFEVTNDAETLIVDMKLISGDVEIPTLGNLMYFAPRGNSFQHRWKGGSEMGSSMKIVSDFRNRAIYTQHLFAESIEDLSDLYIYGKVQAKSEVDGDIKHFSTSTVLNVSSVLKFYNYAKP